LSETLTGSTLEHDVDEYLTRVLRDLADLETPEPPTNTAPEHVAEQIFELVTSREFCPLGRTKAEQYRERSVEWLRLGVETGEPVRFYYDIGPGYHATLRIGELGLRFGMGLSELLILGQVAAFCSRVKRLYAPGARFTLVVDNLCGLYTNAIDVELTSAYCAELRRLIADTGVGDRIDVLVESEEFDLDEYNRLFDEQPVGALSLPAPAEIENVERFLGRRCSPSEAAERVERYVRAGNVTESLLARVVRGVRMTQRASATTIGFRPFSGGDARTQCGEVAFGRTEKGRLRPFLLTHRNAVDYELVGLVSRHLPAAIPSVVFADR
jgi:hypothetical protein